MVALAGCGRTEPYALRVSTMKPPPGGATVAGHIRVDADDFFALTVNGALIDDNKELWYASKTYDVMLACGENVIAIAARNEWVGQSLDRGVIFDLSYANAHVVSDATWTWEAAPDSWKPVTDLGAHGIEPWGAVLGTSSAHWIWSWDSSGHGPDVVAKENVTVRKTFAAACP